MSTNLKSSLGGKVRAARRRLRLTQEQLAERIARTPESVSNIERAQQLPNLETLVDLGRALGIPLSEFFEDWESLARKSPERLNLEEQFREVGRALNDQELKIALRQARIFLDVRP